jgi:hypothetical protein
MGEREDYARGYLKGFEDALNEVWTEVMSFGSRQYSSQELQILARTRKGTVQQAVNMKRAELERLLGVVISPEKRDAVTTVTISPGSSILVREERPDKGFSLFGSLLSRGSAGLSVTRSEPSRIIEKYGLSADATSFIWLTRIEKEEIIQNGRHYAIGNSLPNLAAGIRSFYAKQEECVVILEGLEYLITQFDFRPVLKFIQMIAEQAEYSRGYLIITADHRSLDERDYRLLEKEMTLTI